MGQSFTASEKPSCAVQVLTTLERTFLENEMDSLHVTTKCSTVKKYPFTFWCSEIALWFILVTLQNLMVRLQMSIKVSLYWLNFVTLCAFKHCVTVHWRHMIRKTFLPSVTLVTFITFMYFWLQLNFYCVDFCSKLKM